MDFVVRKGYGLINNYNYDRESAVALPFLFTSCETKYKFD